MILTEPMGDVGSSAALCCFVFLSPHDRLVRNSQAFMDSVSWGQPGADGGVLWLSHIDLVYGCKWLYFVPLPRVAASLAVVSADTAKGSLSHSPFN